MGLLDDFSRFLETRLEEFLRAHPQLELQALEEQLREQEEDTLRLVTELRQQEQRLQEQILETAQDIQRWHIRIEKAKQSRPELVEPAQQREAALLRHGNQLWGQMQGAKQRQQQAQALLQQIQQRRQEVRAKAAELETARAAAKAQTEVNWATRGWNEAYPQRQAKHSDPLEEQFRRLELEDEMAAMKQQMRN
ncbi:TIGR04376 family protein [Trichothermofontia sp.]